MQRLTYTNLRGQVLDLFSNPPYILGSVKGTGLPEQDIMTSKGAAQPGSTVRGMLRKERFVEAEFSVLAKDRAELYELRQRLSALLATQAVYVAACQRMGRLIYENDIGQWWCYAVPDGAPREVKRFQNTYPAMSLTFRCGDPYWRSLDEYNVRMELGNGGFRLPFRLPIRFGGRNFAADAYNEGDIDTPAVIAITGAGESPAVINRTTGAEIRLALRLAVGETLTINTDPDALSVVLRKVDGSEESAFGYLDGANALSAFVLAPGHNAIEYAPSELSPLSKAQVNWRIRAEGV